MYKPIIVARPPWWRHHIFPWGWRRLENCILAAGGKVRVDGYYKPNDGGGGLYRVVAAQEQKVNG